MIRKLGPKGCSMFAILATGLFGEAYAANNLVIDLDEYDINRDGKLDAAEESAYRDAAIQAARVQLAAATTGAGGSAANKPEESAESALRISPNITVFRPRPVGINAVDLWATGGEVCSSGFWSCFKENGVATFGVTASSESEQKKRSADIGYEVAYAVTRNLLPESLKRKNQLLTFNIAPGLSYGRDRVELSEERRDVDRIEFQPFKFTYQWNKSGDKAPALFLGFGYSWSKARKESLTDGAVTRESGDAFTWSPGISFPTAWAPLSVELAHTVRLEQVFSDKESSETVLGISIDMSEK